MDWEQIYDALPSSKAKSRKVLLFFFDKQGASSVHLPWMDDDLSMFEHDILKRIISKANVIVMAVHDDYYDPKLISQIT